LLDVKDRVRRISLRENCFFPGKANNLPPFTNRGKELLRIELGLFLHWYGWCHQFGFSWMELHPRAIVSDWRSPKVFSFAQNGRTIARGPNATRFGKVLKMSNTEHFSPL
jgi:hypothetical protein